MQEPTAQEKEESAHELLHNYNGMFYLEQYFYKLLRSLELQKNIFWFVFGY